MPLFWRVEPKKHHGIMIIDELRINENFRRKGCGKRLLRASLKDATFFLGKDGYDLEKVLSLLGKITCLQENSTRRSASKKYGLKDL